MAITKHFDLKAIDEQGKVHLMGEYPDGQGNVLEAVSSSRRGSTWFRLIISLNDEPHVVKGTVGEVKGFREALQADGTFDTKNFRYSCSGGTPEIIPVS